MGTYSRPDIIRTSPHLAAAQAGAQINAAIQNTWERVNSAYQENLKKNEEQRAKEIEDYKEWGKQLNDISDTGLGGYQTNVRNYLESSGDLKYDLTRRQRLPKDHKDYLTDKEAADLDIMYENIPSQVSKLNGAITINLQKYLESLKNGTLDYTRSDNKWLNVMKDFHENDGRNMSVENGNLIYAPPGGTKVTYNGTKFIQGSLEGHSLLHTKGDRITALSGLVNDAMGKGPDGKLTGWYEQGLAKSKRTSTTGKEWVEYDNETLFYGDEGRGGIYGLDYTSILGNKSQMESLWGELQQDAVNGKWVDGETGDPILKDDYVMTAWNPNSDSDVYKLAAKLIPASISADRTNYGIQPDEIVKKEMTFPSTRTTKTTDTKIATAPYVKDIMESIYNGTESFFENKIIDGKKVSDIIIDPETHTITLKSETKQRIKKVDDEGNEIIERAGDGTIIDRPFKEEIIGTYEWNKDNLTTLVKKLIKQEMGTNKMTAVMNQEVKDRVSSMLKWVEDQEKLRDPKYGTGGYVMKNKENLNQKYNTQFYTPLFKTE